MKTAPISHDQPCPWCGHGYHHYFPCECGCAPHPDYPGDF